VNLREFLASREVSQDAAGVLARVDRSTITRIVNGQARARPATVVRLAKAFGIKASRMQAMCEAHYLAAHPDEVVPA
jgi:plasmid maintenance system antidote protein VapI